MTDNVTDDGEGRRVEGGQNRVEPADTFVQEIGSIDDVNEGTRRFNNIVNELRKRGHSKIRVAIVEVSADV